MRRNKLPSLICSIVLLLSGCFGKQQETMPPETMPLESEPGVITYQGERYRQKENLTTLLMLGLDKNEREADPMAYTNHMQSDFLLLVVLDEASGKVELLHINRDTMTKIRRIGVIGGEAGSFTGQLALAHTYGSGGSDSCLNAVKAVSELLLDTPIDHYMSLTMDAVGTVNDRLGGIEVEILEDMTRLDPAMAQGKVLRLNGAQALTYVRSRVGVADGSNLNRMERQKQYLEELYRVLLDRCAQEEDFLAKLLLEVSEDFLSDCSVTELERISKLMARSELGKIHDIAGEAVSGDPYVEFYPEETALYETVLNLFYEQDR